jgi:uncharacterized protein (DUF433 family)
MRALSHSPTHFDYLRCADGVSFEFEETTTTPRVPERRAEVAMKFTRITVDPHQMGGVACIRGLRIPVATVVGMVAAGMAETEILAAYPDLQHEDIAEALHYAAAAVRERELPTTVP